MKATLKRTDDMTDTLPPPSAAAIAARVTKSNRLRLAENTLTRLRERREENTRAQRKLYEASRDTGAPDTIRAMRALEQERLQSEDEIRRARAEVLPLREEHVTAIAGALQLIRSDAARRILTAISEIKTAAAVLDDVALEIHRAGGDSERPVLLLPLGQIENLARRLAGNTNE